MTTACTLMCRVIIPSPAGEDQPRHIRGRVLLRMSSLVIGSLERIFQNGSVGQEEIAKMTAASVPVPRDSPSYVLPLQHALQDY